MVARLEHDMAFATLITSFGELHQTGLYIHLSESLPSTLYYHGGNCTWRLSGIITGHDLVVNAPYIQLENLDNGVEISCEVTGTLVLQAVISQYGKDIRLHVYLYISQ